jgi:hypothetical protein
MNQESHCVRHKLYKICDAAITANHDVIFAAIVDSMGTLIVGEYKKNLDTEKNDDIFIHHNTSNIPGYIFYLNYLTAAIENCSSKRSDNSVMINMGHQFQFIYINNKTKMAVIPLPDNKDRYLCLYI